MPTLTHVTPDGAREDVDVAEGAGVMQGAVRHGIGGTVAECGGDAVCATRHIYVAEDRLHVPPEMKEEEDGLLDNTAGERRPNSRLSRHIPATAALHGPVVEPLERRV